MQITVKSPSFQNELSYSPEPQLHPGELRVEGGDGEDDLGHSKVAALQAFQGHIKDIPALNASPSVLTRNQY